MRVSCRLFFLFFFFLPPLDLLNVWSLFASSVACEIPTVHFPALLRLLEAGTASAITHTDDRERDDSSIKQAIERVCSSLCYRCCSHSLVAVLVLVCIYALSVLELSLQLELHR